MGSEKFKLKLQDGRIKTLLGVIHITAFDKKLIIVSKMDDAGVKIMFNKDPTRWFEEDWY